MRDQGRYSKFSTASCCAVVHTFRTCIPNGSCRHYIEQPKTLVWKIWVRDEPASNSSITRFHRQVDSHFSLTWCPTSCIHNSNMPRVRKPDFRNFQQVVLNCRHQNISCHHNDRPSECFSFRCRPPYVQSRAIIFPICFSHLVRSSLRLSFCGTASCDALRFSAFQLSGRRPDLSLPFDTLSFSSG